MLPPQIATPYSPTSNPDNLCHIHAKRSRVMNDDANGAWPELLCLWNFAQKSLALDTAIGMRQSLFAEKQWPLVPIIAECGPCTTKRQF
ncbi:unnamed protein product [Ilex paraguariensis]|uniref:Uncharacterized protein n=1 Tax=Ilex paraguariensis TaxID=185542 RepID=A0ABC8TZR8_9AQUA